MNYTPIGRVRPIHRGAHDPSTAYAALDVVRREDGFASYMARRDVPAGTPLADGEYWGLLSDGGLKAVADASCPAFEECGGAAVCHPVAGYPLEVATLIALKQAGDGEPSPDNIRRISGWTGAKLTRCGKNLAKSMKSTDITGLYGSALFLGADLKPSATYTLSFVATAGNQLFVNNNISEYQEISTSKRRLPSDSTWLSPGLYSFPSAPSDANRMQSARPRETRIPHRRKRRPTVESSVERSAPPSLWGSTGVSARKSPSI